MTNRRDARYDVVVIGAGAAGMMCAAHGGAARPPRAADRALSRPRREDPHLRRRPLQLHQPQRRPRATSSRAIRTSAARRSRATRRAISSRWSSATASRYHEKKLGQLFCDDTARDIIAMLKAECDRGGVEWRMPCPVDGVTREGDALARRDAAWARFGARIAGHRHRRPHGAEDRRHAVRLSHRRAVRPRRRAADAGAGAARVRRRRRSRATAIWPASRSTSR